MEIAFSKNLQHAQFQTILSLGANHCGTSRDNKTSKFFSHSFSRHNSEKLIRTLRIIGIIGRLEDKQEDIFLEKVEKKFKKSTGKDTEMAEAAACRCCSK